MTILSSLRSWWRRSRRAGHPRPRSCQPRVEELEPRTVPTVLAVTPNVNLGHEDTSQSETAIAIDPANPLWLFGAANENVAPIGMYGSWSKDGGATWHNRVIAAGNDNLVPGLTDPWVAWDNFGNLFFTYIDSTGTLDVVNLSTDGGVTFNTIATIPCQDQPKVAVGEDMVWVCFNNGSMQATGAPVFGLGVVGAFLPVLTIPNSAGENFGDLSIGPTGAVTLNFQNSGSGAGPDSIEVSTKPDGLGPLGFSNPVVATNTNVGSFRTIPAQPVRQVDAGSSLAYDRSGGIFNGRLYMTYTDAPSVASDDLEIFLRFSDDQGATWSAPQRVNDDLSLRSHFFDRVQVDQTTGIVAVCWYDCRNDPGFGPGDTDGIPNDDVEIFATVSLTGGLSVLPNVQVAAGPSNAIAAGDNGGNDFGDYLGLAFDAGSFFPCWTDNSAFLPGNTDRPNFDIATARVTVTPPPARVFYPLRYLSSPGSTILTGNLTIPNYTFQTLIGPALLVFPALPPGVVLADATGTTPGGDPYIFVPQFTLSHTDPLRVPLVFFDPLGFPLSTFYQGFPVLFIQAGPTA